MALALVGLSVAAVPSNGWSSPDEERALFKSIGAQGLPAPPRWLTVDEARARAAVEEADLKKLRQEGYPNPRAEARLRELLALIEKRRTSSGSVALGAAKMVKGGQGLPERVFVAKYRAKQSAEFHKENCAALVGIIRQVPLNTALRTKTEPCPSCFPTLAGDGKESKDLAARVAEQERRTAAEERERAALAAAQATAAAASPGFRKATWGMSVAQVKSTESAQLEVEGDDALTYRGSYDGRDCLVAYTFDTGELNSGHYIFRDPTKSLAEHKRDLEAHTSRLSKDYGPPLVVGSSNPVWEVASGTITCHLDPSPDQSGQCVWLSFYMPTNDSDEVAIASRNDSGSPADGTEPGKNSSRRTELQPTTAGGYMAEAQRLIKNVEPQARAQLERTTVYIADTGDRYHTENCHHVRKSKHAISLLQAAGKYQRCKVCRP